MPGWAFIPGLDETSSSRTEKPNILVIWGDGIGTWNISHNNRGMMGFETPNIDRIANEDLSFTTLAAGYRALHQDYDHNNFEWDVTMHGPAIGAVLRFERADFRHGAVARARAACRPAGDVLASHGAWRCC